MKSSRTKPPNHHKLQKPAPDEVAKTDPNKSKRRARQDVVEQTAATCATECKEVHREPHKEGEQIASSLSEDESFSDDMVFGDEIFSLAPTRLVHSFVEPPNEIYAVLTDAQAVAGLELSGGPSLQKPSATRFIICEWLKSLPPMTQADRRNSFETAFDVWKQQARVLIRYNTPEQVDGDISGAGHYHSLVVWVKHLARLAQKQLLPNDVPKLRRLLRVVMGSTTEEGYFEESDLRTVRRELRIKWLNTLSTNTYWLMCNTLVSAAAHFDAFERKRAERVLPGLTAYEK